MVTPFQLGLILFICFGSLTYGYCSSIIATTLGQPSFITYFDLTTARPNATSLIGAINGLYQAGGLFGALSVLVLPDRWGRRWALFIGGAICTIGCALQAGAVHIAIFLVGRLLAGYGVGSLVTLVPLYQSEVSPTPIRGLLVGMHGVMLSVGYTSASWAGVGFYFVHGGNQWRGPLAIQTLFPLLLCLGVFWVPESPRWLLLQDRSEAALAEFERIHLDRKATGECQHRHVVEQEFMLMRAQVQQEARSPLRLRDFWLNKGLRRRCVIGFLTFVAGQGTGTLVINNYGPTIYSGLGFSTVQQLLIQAGWISVCPLANLINSLIVDRVGRVRLILLAVGGCTVALIGASATIARFEATGDRGVAAAAVFFLFLHVTIYATTYDATSYIYASEIFPNPARARGLGISVTGLFASTILYLQPAPIAFATIAWKYYTVFIAVSVAMLVVVWFAFPETSGKSLEDVAEVFGDNVALEDENLEAIHQKFKASRCREGMLENAMNEKEEPGAVQEIERT